MQPFEVKAASEAVITRLGGGLCDWLPCLERTAIRQSVEAVERTLVLHAMLQIHFGAPAAVIAAWLAGNGLNAAMSRRERQLLAGGDERLTEQDRTDLYWYIEALWAMAWAGQLINDLPIDRAVGDELAALMPNLQANESAAGFRSRFRLRSAEELYAMLDLYFRAHWYARDGQLRGYPTGVFNLDVIMERRKALEWLNDSGVEDWDDTEMST